MRLDEITPFTSLSLEQLRSALASADVRSVLPVTSLKSMRDHVLVATPEGLAIVTSRTVGESGPSGVVVDWARWSHVQLSTGGDRADADDPSYFDIVVRVGRKAFHALLPGPAGQKALREFVVSVQRGVKGNLAYVDYDAAAMLTH